MGGNCERSSAEVRGKKEGEDNEKESRIRRKKGQKDKEQDSSLWISLLIAFLLLLSDRQRGHTLDLFPLHRPIAPESLPLYLAFAFKTNQGISAEEPEGRTTLRTPNPVPCVLPSFPPTLFLSPFSPPHTSIPNLLYIPAFSFFPPAPPSFLLPPPSPRHHFHQPSLSGLCGVSGLG